MRDLTAGSMFGEVAILYETRRTASVKSKDQVTVGSLNIENYMELCNLFPEIETNLRKATREYNDKWK